MSEIHYTHERNMHSLEGGIQGLGYLTTNHSIKSMLDVGAGTGTWLHAARLAGIEDVLGVDGVVLDQRQSWVDSDIMKNADLCRPLRLGRRFDAVLCLEVAEHLPPYAAATLITSLCAHGDLIYFSAAVPGQCGDHHINCQWPTYWQKLFNDCGFACHDDIRLRMWDDHCIEPWYRQNIFSARRHPDEAGREARIPSLVHPEMVRHIEFPEHPAARRCIDIEAGSLHPLTYLKFLSHSIQRRLVSRLAGGN